MPGLDQRSLHRQMPASTAARMAATAAITATCMNPDFESGAGSHGAEFERVVGNSLGPATARTAGERLVCHSPVEPAC